MPRADASRKRCAIYTRKSSEEGLEQEFNSLAAQREACEAYIRSQQHEGWVLARSRYDDGGFSGGSMERPALQNLLADIRRLSAVARHRRTKRSYGASEFRVFPHPAFWRRKASSVRCKRHLRSGVHLKMILVIGGCTLCIVVIRAKH